MPKISVSPVTGYPLDRENSPFARLSQNKMW